MDKHPQNWFYWLNRNAPATGFIVTVVIALSSAGWALHTWQKSNASLDISGQVSIGGDVTQVGGDLIITGDPVDQKTIGHLNNLLGRYRAELDQRDIELADKEALIAQLKTTLELAQKIAAGGDYKLASRARALLADLGPGSLGAALLPDLRALIQDYEQGPIKDLVQLHMGGRLNLLRGSAGLPRRLSPRPCPRPGKYRRHQFYWRVGASFRESEGR